ncbi:carbohydrate-binding module family 13 protein [Macrolepiota fuliginosa MF-IS2]|uniref:Carbohydrate-binding module family 13 protein n=1 Tax=Macrolepiota fuliginosa MF-IS2 TaxID=1400762 RepID=A0A9P6BXR8_9AGAR|nr:carbohydrate-binding module family 13 protein [Macrolepiota fuliginosa MF-IS2]
MKFSYLSLLAFVSSALSQTQVLHPNGDKDVCLDVKDGRFVNGNPLQIWPCNGTPAQQWNFVFGPTTIRLGDTGFCLDATTTNPSNGTPMRIWECTSVPEQQWFSAVTSTGDICLDVNRGDHTPGTVVQAWECLKGETNQIWTN